MCAECETASTTRLNEGYTKLFNSIEQLHPCQERSEVTGTEADAATKWGSRQYRSPEPILVPNGYPERRVFVPTNARM